MVDGVGSGVGHRRQQGGGIGDVHLLVDGHDLVAQRPQVLGQPRADEAATAGDEGAHDGSPYWLRGRGRHHRGAPIGRRRTGRPPCAVRRWPPRCGGPRCRSPRRRRSASAGAPPRPAASSSVEGVGQPGHVTRADQHGSVTGHLLHGRARGGDQRGPAGQGLEGREPEPLVEGRVDGHRRRTAAGRGRHRRARTRSARSADASPEASTARSTASVPQPGPPASTSRASGCRSATRAKAADQRGHVLAGLERARRRPANGRPARQAGVQGGRGWRRRIRPPAPRAGTPGVDAVGGHEHLGLHPAPPGQLLGGHLARADHGRRPAGGHLDGPAEQEDLGPLVPRRAARRSSGRGR